MLSMTTCMFTRMSRSLPVILITLSIPFSAAAQYRIVLMSGDTLMSRACSDDGDSLKLKDRHVSKRDVQFVDAYKKRRAYKHEGGKEVIVPIFSDPVLSTATCCAAKYGGSELGLGQFALPDKALLTDQRFIAAFRTALLDQWIQTDIEGRYLKTRVSEEKGATSNIVILRTGDTLDVGKKDFYIKGDTLCWFGGGRTHKDQVLLLYSAKGLRYIRDATSKAIPFHPPICDLSPCYQGVAYAHIYGFNLGDLKAPPLSGEDLAVFQASCEVEHAFMVERAEQKTESLTGAHVGMGVLRGILFALP